MTQGRLFPSDEAGSTLVTYLMDTCVPIWLDCLNKEPDGKCRYTPDEAKVIWAALEDLARVGRLKIITQVKAELEDQHKAAKERLCAHRGHRAPNISKKIRLVYKDVVRDFPTLVRVDWPRDPADPWLVAYAQEYAFTVVTEEKPAAEHTQRFKRRRFYIPDVCEARCVPWLSLRKLAVEERWLPT